MLHRITIPRGSLAFVLPLSPLVLTRACIRRRSVSVRVSTQGNNNAFSCKPAYDIYHQRCQASYNKPHDIGILRGDGLYRGIVTRSGAKREDTGFRSYSIHRCVASNGNPECDPWTARAIGMVWRLLVLLDLFVCPICDSSFTCAEGVNYHFPGCVEKYGNPQGHSWSDHPSCSSKTAAKEGPASKKRRTETPSIPSDSNEVARVQTPSLPNILPTEPRVTRSRQAQMTAGIQVTSQQGALLIRPRASQTESKAQPKMKVVAVKSTKTSRKFPKASVARPKLAKAGRGRRQFRIDTD